MNKLYAFLAIIFLSSCGSPGIDGSWSDVKNADIGIEITGDQAKLTQKLYSITCPIKEGDKGFYIVYCSEEDILFYLRLDDGILKVLEERYFSSEISFDEARKFVRK